MTLPPNGSPPQHNEQETPSTPEVAKHQAAEVGNTAAQGGEQVMQTVGEQTRRVAEETTRQARNVLHEGRQQLTEQAREGQKKAAEGLHTLADQLDNMYDKSDGSGIGPDVVHQAAGHTRTVASWLEDRQPGDLVHEVRDFARRKPGVFLAGAAIAGMLVGRLTRGVVAAQREDSPDRAESAGAPDQIRNQTPHQATTEYPNPASPQGVPPGYPAPPVPVYSQPPAQYQTPTGQTPPPWQGPGAVPR
jgi:ElaB/YqjD/DUF883 family membrane-anchored ribosome-binding protein